MIALSRAAVRRFRLVARRGLPPGRPRGLAPPVQIIAGKGTVRLAAHLTDLVVALRVPMSEEGGAGSLILPLNELERFEGTGPEVVTLEAGSPVRGTARWRIHDAPCSTEFTLANCDLAWPPEPKKLMLLPPTFPQALHEAGRTSARESDKYAVHRIQVRGKLGQLISTDGKQALVQGGFVFPFTEDLLVPAVPLFGCKELAEERAVSIGRIEKWLFLVIGPWQVSLSADGEQRFPDVMGAIPRAAGTRVVIDDRDAGTVLEAFSNLSRQPGDELQSVTIDLGRHVAVRTRQGSEGKLIEVPLIRTECYGPHVHVVLNREHLGRALALGFREFRCSSPERPVVARDGERIYLTATLDPTSAIRSSQKTARAAISDAVPVESPSSPSESPDQPRSTAMPVRESPTPERNGHVEPAPGDLIDPLAEAEALRTALAESAQRAGRLLASLKHYRKERKTLQAAWSSLRGLNLGS